MSTILLIEDNKLNADIMIRVLTRSGHEVFHASEGLVGLTIATNQQIDIALVDLGLPDVGGTTIIALLKRLPHDIPIVVVTASTEYADWRQSINRGCIGYMTKPINTRTFAGEVETFLSRYAGENTQGTHKKSEVKPASSDGNVSTLY